MRITRILLTLLLAAGRAHAADYWFKTAEPAQVVTMAYVDTVSCDDEPDAFGCYYQFGMSGYILIRRGMPEYLERCTLAHEQKHAKGWRHPKGWLGFVDCGNGEWISAETLKGLLQ